MNIRSRLLLALIALTVLPLFLTGYFGLREMKNISTLTVEESVNAMKVLGEGSIRQKAVDVARQVSLYLEAHPGLDDLMADPELGMIAVQSVGLTGYTALYDSSGVVYFHANRELVGQNMDKFSESLPEFWEIFATSLDGTSVGSYYLWKEPDGSLREKYMECVPIDGTSYRIAATTYIDEFYAPIRTTQQTATRILASTLIKGMAVLLGTAALSLLVALKLSSFVSEPVLALIGASQAVETGRFADVNLSGVEKRTDEFGGLGRVFSKMVRHVESRERILKDEVADLRVKVQLFIEIDDARRDRAVREITETEYFDDLVKRAELMRRSRSQTD